MDAHRLKLLAAAAVMSCAALLVAQAQSASILTIKGSSTESGDTIEFPDGAQLDIAVGPESITLTLPEVDVRVQCLGAPTEEGYCLLEAGSGSGGGAPSDSDGDGVYDGIDSCSNTPPNSVVTSNGCLASDSDSDGVYDKDDNCSNTAANSFVNSVGCSSDQLGGGGGDPDADGDGVADNTDNCLNTPNPNQQDSDNDGIGDACDDDGGDPPPTTSGYCTNSQSSRVSCLPTRNMDPWSSTTGENEKTIAAGKILSLPFTTRTSSSDTVELVYTTDVGPLLSTQYSWRSWVSQYPGGAIWDASDGNKCYTAGAQARANMTVTQNQSTTSQCRLPTASATFYLNYAVRGPAGYYPSNYKFGVARQ